MARFNLPINSFIAGEMSPNTRGRTDLQQYQQGCEEIYNMLVDVQGGASRRAGSIYEGITGLAGFDQDSWDDYICKAAYSRTFPYYRSDGKRMLLIITNTANTATTPQSWMGSIDIATQKFHNLSSASFFAYFDESREITAEQLRAASYCQAGDILVVQIPTHPTIFVGFITRGSSAQSDWTAYPIGQVPEAITQYVNPYTLKAYQFPYLARNVLNSQGKGTLQSSATSGVATLTASLSTLLLNEHRGAYFKINSGTSTGHFIFDTLLTATTASVNAVTNLPTTGAVGNSGTTSWEEAAFSDAQGWPVSVVYHQQRLYYLMANGTIYASQAGNVFNLMARKFEQDPAFSTTVVASDPYSFTISAKEPPIGRWLHSAKNLQIGTLGREFISTGSSALEPSVDAESSLGSAAAQPARIDNALYFVQRAGQSIRQLTYNNDEDAYQAADLNILSSHIVRKSSIARTSFTVPRFVQLEAQLSNSPVLWAVDVNGGLCSCTIDRSSNVYAWAYHELGGNLSGEKPKVMSIAVLPSNEGRHDDVFITVQRTINSTVVNTVERITRGFELENLYNASTDIDDKPVFADAAILYTAGAPTTICDNLDHLEGEEVDVMGDGHYIGRFTVASGQVDVGGSKLYTEFIAGLPYTSRLVTNSLEGGSQIGSAQGLHKRAAKATLRLVRTIGLRYGLRTADLNGTDTDNMFELSFKPIGGLGGVPIPLFTGDKLVDLPLGIDRKQRIVVEQTKSLPMTVAAIFLDGQTNA